MNIYENMGSGRKSTCRLRSSPRTSTTPRERGCAHEEAGRERPPRRLGQSRRPAHSADPAHRADRADSAACPPPLPGRVRCEPRCDRDAGRVGGGAALSARGTACGPHAGRPEPPQPLGLSGRQRGDPTAHESARAAGIWSGGGARSVGHQPHEPDAGRDLAPGRGDAHGHSGRNRLHRNHRWPLHARLHRGAASRRYWNT